MPCKVSMFKIPSDACKVYTMEDLHLLTLMAHPVWVFDIQGKKMLWANPAACKLVWNAEDLESLLARDFTDMSQATERRLSEYLQRFERGDTVVDQWTYHPQGRAVTCRVSMSGIKIKTENDENNGGSKLYMLNEGIPLSSQEQSDRALRGAEMLRHLPVAVCEFDSDGHLIYQNPESVEVFGLEDPGDAECTFLSRFHDRQVGKKALEMLVSHKSEIFFVEAQQRIKGGELRWFSISLRKSLDPVNSEPIILQSARDITDVMEAKQVADRANMEKSEFLAVMAHELRTPLHQVIGFVELMNHTSMTGQQSEYIRLMQSSSISLMSIINDLLDYTKIEAGKLNLESILFEVKGVLEGCQQAMQPKVNEKGLALKLNLPVGLPVKMLGDPNRLRQILSNLLQNAVKFTHKGSIQLSVTHVLEEEPTTTTTTTTAESSDDKKADSNNNNNSTTDDLPTGPKVRLRFAVTDTGIGICPQNQNIIFSKYQQASSSIARQYGGTGLGLSICKSLVEAMGGTIRLDSKVGKGTTVTFDVLFETPPKPSINLSNDNLITPNCGTSSESALMDSSVKGLKVLVVEDNKMNQKVVKAMLQRMGHFVKIADNGAIGAELVENKEEEFDVVLMDVQMPVMDGIEATKLIRSKGFDSLPIVGLTASYQPADYQYYQDIGMNDCIGKPVRMQTLKNLLVRLCSPDQATPIAANTTEKETERAAAEVAFAPSSTTTAKTVDAATLSTADSVTSPPPPIKTPNTEVSTMGTASDASSIPWSPTVCAGRSSSSSPELSSVVSSVLSQAGAATSSTKTDEKAFPVSATITADTAAATAVRLGSSSSTTELNDATPKVEKADDNSLKPSAAMSANRPSATASGISCAETSDSRASPEKPVSASEGRASLSKGGSEIRIATESAETTAPRTAAPIEAGWSIRRKRPGVAQLATWVITPPTSESSESSTAGISRVKSTNHLSLMLDTPPFERSVSRVKSANDIDQMEDAIPSDSSVSGSTKVAATSAVPCHPLTTNPPGQVSPTSSTPEGTCFSHTRRYHSDIPLLKLPSATPMMKVPSTPTTTPLSTALREYQASYETNTSFNSCIRRICSTPPKLFPVLGGGELNSLFSKLRKNNAPSLMMTSCTTIDGEEDSSSTTTTDSDDMYLQQTTKKNHANPHQLQR